MQELKLKNSNIIKSIVVSSKNGEAIENVGNEIDKETKYMLPISRKYNRTQIVNGTKIKEPAQYKGLVCLPLGKQNNIQDFKDFLYKRFLFFIHIIFLLIFLYLLYSFSHLLVNKYIFITIKKVRCR